ncbi:MAG: restriction endonuclease subunit S [Kiritimatiellae bacterium]|nr:restriction endonuclease subunit S [Kiritimatiellia bacterium]
MAEWKRVKLGEICSRICSGGTPKSTCRDYYENGEIPWLNTKEVHSNRIYGTENRITQLGLDNSSAKWVKADSVIVAMYGATAGNVAQTRIPLTTNQACCNLEVDSDKASADFVFYYLRNCYSKLLLLANGAAQQNLNAQVIREYEIPLPPLPTQRKIAAVLGTLDDKVENNRKICANLEAQAQALFKSWFVDFEPFGGKMPSGWKMGTLGEIAEVIRDSIAPDEMPEIVEHYSLPAFDSSQLPVYEQSSTIKSNKFRVSKGALLISKLNPSIKRLWDPFVDTDTAVSSTEFVVIVPDKVELKSFIYSVLDSQPFFAYAKAHAAGTTNSHQRVSPDDIMRYEIAIPAVRVTQDYDAIIKPMLEMRKEALKQSASLAATRDALLPKLMSGEIDVEKVEV